MGLKLRYSSLAFPCFGNLQAAQCGISCYVLFSDPSGVSINGRITKQADKYYVQFTPLLVGPHDIAVQYGGQSIPGSPYTCNVYDASKVKILDTTPVGVIGDEMGFTGDKATFKVLILCKCY